MGDCNVTSHGARLLLQKELNFKTVTFFGHLSVLAVAYLDTSCVVMGEGTVAAGATLRVENCINEGRWGKGGGASAPSLQVDGHLEIHRCHVVSSIYGGGGGVYVRGLSVQLKWCFQVARP